MCLEMNAFHSERKTSSLLLFTSFPSVLPTGLTTVDVQTHKEQQPQKTTLNGQGRQRIGQTSATFPFSSIISVSGVLQMHCKDKAESAYAHGILNLSGISKCLTESLTETAAKQPGIHFQNQESQQKWWKQQVCPIIILISKLSSHTDR